jgi:Coenzyme PQQ synthesis protein D (PqqD)
MEKLFSSKAVAPDNVLVRELSGEAVLLNLDNEMYFGLDEVGYRIWKVLTTTDFIGDAYKQLLSEYEVEPGELRRQLEALIHQCEEQGLLRLEPRQALDDEDAPL